MIFSGPHDHDCGCWRCESRRLAMAAGALVGRRVRFNHEVSDLHGHLVTGATGGMVTLEGWSGEFAPHLFVTIDSDDPRARV